MGNPNYAQGFAVTTHERMLALPLSWSKPRLVFVNSMSDLFHDEVPDSFVQQVFATMRRTPWHTYQVLTKRSERLATMAGKLDWPKNVWAGVSIENDEYVHRAQHLLAVQAPIRFLSIEPLLGPIGNLNLSGIDWVILGGESGPGARPMQAEWVRQIRDQCVAECVPFFFKQWGGVWKKKNGRRLDGRTWDSMPVIDNYRIEPDQLDLSIPQPQVP